MIQILTTSEPLSNLYVVVGNDRPDASKASWNDLLAVTRGISEQHFRKLLCYTICSNLWDPFVHIHVGQLPWPHFNN